MIAVIEIDLKEVRNRNLHTHCYYNKSTRLVIENFTLTVTIIKCINLVIESFTLVYTIIVILILLFK